MLFLSTHIVPTPHIVESRVTTALTDFIQQREQSRIEALRVAASLRGTTGSLSPSQIMVTTTFAVVSGLMLEETESPLPSRQIPISLIATSAEGYIWPGYPNAQYVNVFPPEMSLSQQNPDYRLDPEEGWRLLYPFTEPNVQLLTPVNLACMAKSDSIVEMIQIHAYLEDVPEVGRRDFRR